MCMPCPASADSSREIPVARRDTKPRSKDGALRTSRSDRPAFPSHWGAPTG
jgi:hypothetical protein